MNQLDLHPDAEVRGCISDKKKTLGNALFPRVCGGRNRTRTCDPIDVNDVLYQLSHATMPFDSKGILSRTGFAVKDEII